MRTLSAAIVILPVLAAGILNTGANAAVPRAGAAHGEITAAAVARLSLQPDDPAWQQVKAVRIPLMAQNFVPPFGGGATAFVEVKSLHTGGELFFRLSWPDKTDSTKLGLSGKFADGCALQFPLRPGTPPSFMMGQKGSPVNIWLWKGVAQQSEKRYDQAYSDFYRAGAITKTVKLLPTVQNLVAEGFSTLTPLPVQEVQGTGVWKDGRWTVVLKRKLNSPNGASFPSSLIVPIAFAVWDGGSKERDGFKSLSVWHNLLVAPAQRSTTTPRNR